MMSHAHVSLYYVLLMVDLRVYVTRTTSNREEYPQKRFLRVIGEVLPVYFADHGILSLVLTKSIDQHFHAPLSSTTSSNYHVALCSHQLIFRDFSKLPLSRYLCHVSFLLLQVPFRPKDHATTVATLGR